MAKFIDARLKAGNKGASEEEVEAQLDRALLLFRYISVRGRRLPLACLCVLRAMVHA